MMDNSVKCTICGKSIDAVGTEQFFTDTGSWLAEHHWLDSGTLCLLCLENRGRLALMYFNETELIK